MVPTNWGGEMPVHVNPVKTEVMNLAYNTPAGLRFSIRDETLAMWDAYYAIHGGLHTQSTIGGPSQCDGYFFYNAVEKRFGLFVYKWCVSRYLHSKWASFFHQFKPRKFLSMKNAKAWTSGLDMF